MNFLQYSSVNLIRNVDSTFKFLVEKMKMYLMPMLVKRRQIEHVTDIQGKLMEYIKTLDSEYSDWVNGVEIEVVELIQNAGYQVGQNIKCVKSINKENIL